MLNMNTQRKQTIFIGDNYRLTLLALDEDSIKVSVHEDKGNTVERFTPVTIKAGASQTICPDVKVRFNGIGNNGIQYAILGFEAPRHINIKGEWQNFNRDPGPADRAKLSQMSDASLLYYANINAKSALEHELMNRFKKNIRT